MMISASIIFSTGEKKCTPMKSSGLSEVSGERGDRQSRGVAGEDDVGAEHGLRLLRRLGLHRAVLEHRLDDEVAALELRVVGGRLDAREQRLLVGRLGAALGDLRAHDLVRIGLALVGRFLVAVDQHDLEPGVGRDIGDARAHEARAEHADLLEVGRRNVRRTARALVELAHRQEQRADHRRRFLRQQDVGEMLALDCEREIHRQLQALEHAHQHRLRGRIIVISLAPVDGVGRRPDHHALRREDLARRQLELRIVPRRLGVRIGLHPGLGERDDLIGRRDLVHEAHLLRRGRTDLIALEQHLQSVRRRHQPRDALRAAAAGEEPDLDFRQADARLVRVGDDAIVAGERELEAAAHADAVDRRRDRFAAGLQPPIRQAKAVSSTRRRRASPPLCRRPWRGGRIRRLRS